MLTNKSKISILYLIDTLIAVGGTEKHLLQLLTGLDKARFRFAVCTFKLTNNDITCKIKEYDIPLHIICYNRVFSLDGLAKSYSLYKLIKSVKPDIVETYHHSSDTIGVFIAKIAGVRRIISNKRDMGAYKSRLQRLVSRLTNKFIMGYIAVCRSVAYQFSIDEHIPLKKFKIIYNGIDSQMTEIGNKSKLEEMKNQRKPSNSLFIIACIANLRPEKGHIYLLKAVNILKEKIQNLKLFIIGEGPEKARLLGKVSEMNLEKDVCFTGYVSDLRKYVVAADVVCLPAIYNEGFSNAILESMAFGKPVVATNVGGNAEAIIHGFNGFIVPPADSRSLAESLHILFRDETLRQKMSENAIARVKKLFTLEKKYDEIERYYILQQ